MAIDVVFPEGLVWTEDPRSPLLADAYLAWEALYKDALINGRNRAPLTSIIASGIVSLSSSLSKLLPETGTTDTLDAIDLSSVPDGRVVEVSIGTAGHVITLTHLKAGLTDAGELVLTGAGNVALSVVDDYIRLQRRGGKFYQLRTLASAQSATLTANLDMAGFAAYGGRYFIDSHASAARTIGIADRGKELVNTASCTYTFPMSQPAGTQWQVGDVIYFRQEAANCIFVTSSGVCRSIDSHDRGRGVGAKMEVELVQISGGFVWALAGQTQAAGVVGGISRTFVQIASTATITTDPLSTAWKNGLTLTHTPPDNSSWLYLGNAAFTASTSQGSGLSQMRFFRTALADGPVMGSERYVQGVSVPLLMTAAAYGAAPGLQSITIDAMAGTTAAGNTATLATPRALGLKLETGEFLSQAAGAGNNINNSGVYADFLVMTQTFAADDYYIFAWAQTNTSGQAGLTISLVVDGVTKHEKSESKNSSLPGYFGVIVPVTMTAGSKIIKIQAKSNGAWTSSISSLGICALRKSLFQDTAVVNDGTTTTTTSTTFIDKATLSKALLSGWDYLAVADIDLKLSLEAATSSAQAQLVRNGTRLGRTAKSMVRDNDTWTPVSAGFFEVVQKVLTTDAFALQIASTLNTDTVQAKEATVLLLALAPS